MCVQNLVPIVASFRGRYDISYNVDLIIFSLESLSIPR